MARRRLVFLSDFTVHGWEDFHLSRFAGCPGARRSCISSAWAATQRDANVLVDDVRIIEKPFIEHAPLDMQAVVRNRSATACGTCGIDLLLEQTPDWRATR